MDAQQFDAADATWPSIITIDKVDALIVHDPDGGVVYEWFDPEVWIEATED